MRWHFQFFTFSQLIYICISMLSFCQQWSDLSCVRNAFLHRSALFSCQGFDGMLSLAQKCMDLKSISGSCVLTRLILGILGENTEVWRAMNLSFSTKSEYRTKIRAWFFRLFWQNAQGHLGLGKLGVLISKFLMNPWLNHQSNYNLLFVLSFNPLYGFTLTHADMSLSV